MSIFILHGHVISYQHPVEPVAKAREEESHVVTSGTGSGKGLT